MSNKERILDMLNYCTPKQIHMFKRMYSHDNLERPIDDVVKRMLNIQINRAFNQVERTVDKNKNNRELKLKQIIKKI